MKALSTIDLLENGACRLREIVVLTALMWDVITSPSYYESIEGDNPTSLAEALLDCIRLSLKSILQDMDDGIKRYYHTPEIKKAPDNAGTLSEGK